MRNTLTAAAAIVASLFASASAGAVTFEDLKQSGDAAVQVIDCRDSNYFNGWPEPGEKEGGHLPGALNFSARWLDAMEAGELSRWVEKQSLSHARSVWLYGSEAETQRVKQSLSGLGFTDVQVIDAPLSEYTGELSYLANYSKLVSAEWLNRLQKGEQVSQAPQAQYRVVEVAYGPPVKYLIGHIPGALYLNTNDLESEPHWNRVSPERLEQTFLGLGITTETPVILYGRDTMAAARAANLMMYAGVKDVRLLNGGYGEWQARGYPTEVLLNTIAPEKHFGTQLPAKPELVMDVPGAKALLADPQGSSLVSIRSWAEYTGETSGYGYIKPKGRIAGARWGHGGSDSYSMQDFQNPDGTMVSAQTITDFWADWNITRDQNISFYCGTGWRASEAFFYAYVMGWPKISVFDGGWYEWSKDPVNPVASGEIAAPM